MVELYNGDVKIEFQESVHRYKVNGVYSIGVSSVLNILNKDLQDWASYMAVEAFKEATMEYLTTPAKMTKIGVKTIADNAKKAHRQKSQRGKDVGTIAHEWIKEETDAGETVETPSYYKKLWDNPDLTEEEQQMLNDNFKAATHCVAQWRQWVKDYDVEFIKTETIVHSRNLDYCGTFDLLFRSKRTGKLYMGDYKTSEPSKIRNSKYVITGYKPYPEHFVQISGYDYAHHEEHGTEVDGYMVIYLPKPTKDSKPEYQCFTREHPKEDREEWTHLVKTAKWMGDIRKNK